MKRDEFMDLYVGKKVNIIPTNDSKAETVCGVITYIHPRGKFYIVEYESKRGLLRESFTPTNEEALDLIRSGRIKADSYQYVAPPEHVTAKELEARLAANGIGQISRNKKTEG